MQLYVLVLFITLVHLLCHRSGLAHNLQSLLPTFSTFFSFPNSHPQTSNCGSRLVDTRTRLRNRTATTVPNDCKASQVGHSNDLSGVAVDNLFERHIPVTPGRAGGRAGLTVGHQQAQCMILVVAGGRSRATLLPATLSPATLSLALKLCRLPLQIREVRKVHLFRFTDQYDLCDAAVCLALVYYS